MFKKQTRERKRKIKLNRENKAFRDDMHIYIYISLNSSIHAYTRERIHRVPLFLSVITSLEKRHFAFQHSISSRIPSASSPITANLSGFPIIFFFFFFDDDDEESFALHNFGRPKWYFHGGGEEERIGSIFVA